MSILPDKSKDWQIQPLNRKGLHLRYSRYFIPTLKEIPAEAEVISHQLMLRAGMIRKLAAGVYSILPLGVRVVRKVEAIIRKEMDKSSAMEVILPSIQPAELWKEAGRWNFYGKELLRISDRNDREFCYAPTAEEAVTDLVRGEVRSYKDLPINLYQIQTKFRDEIRPRFGVMRAREFSMKDAYSFDTDQDGIDHTYIQMKQTYKSIFKQCGLKFKVVEADTGQIGGSSSHEFMVLAESGEDTIAYCDECNFASNIEKVSLDNCEFAYDGNHLPMQEIDTPQLKTIGEVSEFLGVSPQKFFKTLVYKTDDENNKAVVAVCRGDHSINPVKLANAIGVNEVTLANEELIESVTGAPVGFVGPIGLKKVSVYGDYSIKPILNGITGANKKDKHMKNVNSNRDMTHVVWKDIRNPVDGDSCPAIGVGKLSLAKGIEVGHIFKLGAKYSKSMGATFLDKNGKEKPMLMGCYGIGVARTIASAIEQSHDEKGIVWPVSIAPFKVIVILLQPKEELVVTTAEMIYADLIKAGHDPILDDRDQRPGVKFNEADLIGFPVQVIVGKKSVANKKAEIKVRKTGKIQDVPLETITDTIISTLDGLG